MSVIEVERPAVPSPAPPAPSNALLSVVRGALLLILAVAAVAALPSTRPTASTAGRLLDELRADRVQSVRYVSASHAVRWSEGRFTWYQADLDAPLPPLPASSAIANGSSGGSSEDWVLSALYATGHSRVDFGVVDSQDRLSWAGQLPWHGLSAAAGGAALAGFLLMLINGGGRIGNRWAWFWVMASTSGLGVVLYLVLEPSPVWLRPSRQRPLPSRPAFLGGAGLLIGFALKPAIALLSLLVTR